jgi:hypothetical protein
MLVMQERRSKHEFVVACVEEIPDHRDHRYYMRAERSVDKSKSDTRFLMFSILVAPQQALDSIKIALDDARLHIESGRGSTAFLASVTFTGERPPLRKLAFMLQLIETFVGEYRLWKHQCYWFCHTIMRVLELEYKPKGAVVEDQKGFSLPGTWNKIPVSRGYQAVKNIQTGLEKLYPKSEPVAPHFYRPEYSRLMIPGSCPYVTW